MRRGATSHWNAGLATTAALAALLLAAMAGAQGTTATLRGVIKDATGPIPGVLVTATSTQSGFVYRVSAGENGTFTMGALPPGTYEVVVASEAYKEQRQTVKVLLGQEPRVDFVLTPSGMVTEAVTVTAEAAMLLVDTRSSAISTNISPEQIESLPLNNRNFLAFSSLAPGVSFTQDTDAQGQYFGSGAAKPEQVNVFIDGLSYKNDIVKGGAFMQDSVRGNPFPQNAVQEYQVLTQNYKAEYEKASAAVITAVTKSGGNEFHGDAFYYYQNKDMVAQDDFAKARGDKKPPYNRDQYGLSVGGPLLHDRLNFFVSAERNQRDVVSSVYRGSSWDQAPVDVQATLEPYRTGSLSSPFESSLFFGKLSWRPSTGQTMDLSYNFRDESDVRDFGAQKVKETAQDFQVKTDAAVLHHQAILGTNALNEANLVWQKMEWIQGAVASSDPMQVYQGLLTIGGATTRQDLTQEKIGLRDDLSYFFDWHGSHSVKVGVTYNAMSYDMTKWQTGNPEFDYAQAEDWQYPFKAVYGFGNPTLAFDNDQYGAYVQDDWKIDTLTVNVGLRWDYETNTLNNDWVTPDAVVSGLENACRDYSQPVDGQTHWCIDDIFNPSDYISTGSNRSSYKNMFQPRVGFSWDPRGDGETIVYGGWGLYYDRTPVNNIMDEQYRHTWKVYTLCFTDDPSQVGASVHDCNAPALLWDDAYLSASGLDALIASGVAPGPEIFLLSNNTIPPRSTQWTLGLRQALWGDWRGGLTYANSRGNNSMVWSFGTLPPGSSFNDRWGGWISIPGYGFIMRSFDTRKSWYDGYILTLDKPFGGDGMPWGFNLAFTYADAEQQGSVDDGNAFAFDSLPPEFATFKSISTETHKTIMSGTVGLGAGFTVSGILTLSSGLPFYYTDCSNGWDNCFNASHEPPKRVFLGLKEFGYRSVDLRAEWQFGLGGDLRIGLIGEAFNVFDLDNDTSYDGWMGGPGDAANAHFGKPSAQINTRRYQVGARFSF